MARNDPLEARLRLFSGLILLVFLILAGRLWHLQILQGETYSRLADGNRLRLVQLTAPRGLIYDRWGQLLVTNRPSFTVSVIPEGLVDADAVCDRLGAILEMDPEEIKEMIDRWGTVPHEPVRIRRDVDAKAVVCIEEHRLELPGVIVEETPMRDYLYGEFGGHIFGYLAMISPEELRELGNRGYRGSDLIGRTGLERYYEDHLRGQDGGQQVEVNAFSRPLRVLGTQSAVPGNNLILTIDWELQMAAEEALEEQLAHIRATTKAKGAYAGCVIVLDPNSGEILALVSQPRYDPNRFIEPGYDPNRFLISVPKDYYQSLQEAPSALNNYALTGQYHPGSAFKPITLIAAFEAGAAGPKTTHYCGGTYKYHRQCWVMTNDPPLAPHGRVDGVEAMADSCNIYFWSIAEAAGIERIAAAARAFGLDQPTGIDLFPWEGKGLIPDPAWKRQQFRSSPGNQGWYPGDTLNVAIGQLVEVTPIQMAVFYGALATKGRIYRPHLVRAITSPTGEVIEVISPELLHVVELRESTWDVLHRGMRAVITEGTARSAFQGAGFTAAGKTGTAQVTGREPNAWFGAWAPAEDPEVVVIVMAENAGGGARVAAPVARRVLEAYFARKEGLLKEGRKYD